MIYTVTVNPCLDEDKRFEQGQLVFGTNRDVGSEKYPGGKGIDVSRAILAVGSRSLATGFIGGHIGELVQGLLAIEGLDCSFVEIRAETRTNVICHMDGQREIRINSRGPRISGDEYLELLQKIRTFEKPEAGLVCGSVCGRMEPNCSYNQILSAFKRRNPQCPTFLDTEEKHTMSALAAMHPPDFIKPNIYEFHRLLRVRVNVQGIAPSRSDPATVDEEYLIGQYCTLHDDLPSAWKLLVDRLGEFASLYPNVRVLLSVSQFGALTLERDTVIHACYSGPVELKTTVGAGDSFLGGFAVSFLRDHAQSVAIALKEGVAASVARLQGQDREYGYINQEKLQEVRGSKDLRVETFGVDETSTYVQNKLMNWFAPKVLSTGAGR